MSARELGGPKVKLDFLNPQTNRFSLTADSRGAKARGKTKARGKK